MAVSNTNDSFRAFFVSDIHIMDMKDKKALVFLNFLKDLPQDTTHLFMLGDIFDIWISDHQHYADHYKPIVDEIKRLKARGVVITYYEGNHDFHLKEFWQGKVGVKVFDSPQYIDIGSLRLRFEHGDESNPDDTSYLRLRKTLRHPFTKFAADNLPGKVVQFIGDNWSSTSRKSKPYVNEKAKLRSRQYAIEVLSKREYDIILFGHTHMRDEFKFEFNGKQFEYINLGTWLESPTAYEITPTKRGFNLLSG